MHELSIAENILDIVLRKVEEEKLGAVTAIYVRIGTLTDVVPESLTFGFDVIKKGTALSETQLRTEIVPLEACCRSCSRNFTATDFIFLCPHCGSSDVEVISGMELEISHLEVEESLTDVSDSPAINRESKQS